MTYYEEINWRGIPLLVAYESSSEEFSPSCVVPIVDGEEGPVCDNLLHFLTIDAINEIGAAVLDAGKD